MPLHAGIPVPERILAYGYAGAGKTFMYFTIARWLLKTGSDAQMYVLDTDRTVERTMVTEFPEVDARAGGNLHYTICTKWKPLKDATKEYASVAKAGDWIVCDMLGPQSWKYVQNYYHEAKHGKSDDELADFMLQEAAKRKKATGDGEGWNWQFINGVYSAWIQEFALDGPWHVFATAGVSALGQNDDKATRVTYGPLGCKPVGQKDAAHLFHTSLLVSGTKEGVPQVSTAKDRGRTKFDNTPVADFTTNYLVNNAGWQLA